MCVIHVVMTCCLTICRGFPCSHDSKYVSWAINSICNLIMIWAWWIIIPSGFLIFYFLFCFLPLSFPIFLPPHSLAPFIYSTLPLILPSHSPSSFPTLHLLLPPSLTFPFSCSPSSLPLLLPFLLSHPYSFSIPSWIFKSKHEMFYCLCPEQCIVYAFFCFTNTSAVYDSIDTFL